MGMLTMMKSGGDVFRDEFSLAFDGTNDYVDLGATFNHNAHSISTWIKVTADTTSKFIFDARDGDNDGILLNINTLEKISYQNDTVDVLYETALTEGVWYHIVATNDGTTSRIYLNGVGVGNTADTSGVTISTTTTGRIGARSHSSPESYFSGNISELAFYTSALSASQVKTLYNGREPYNHKEGIASGNLKAWWRMGDGTFDQKSIDDQEGGIVTDMVTPTLGADVLGGKGDFSDPSYWVVTTDQTVIEDGVGKWIAEGTGCDGGNCYGQIAKSGDLTSGQIYRIDLDVNAHNGSADHSITLNFGSPYIRLHVGSQTGHSVVYFKAEGTDLILYQALDYDVVAEIDNVVVRPVNGNAGAMLNFGDITSFEGDTP